LKNFNRRKFIACGAGLLALAKSGLAQQASMEGCDSASGPFHANWESLKAYRCPDWFRDAKFGIWAHWSPQCVPGQGDWYARGMYIQGSPQYDYHVKTYGHPSQFGYKDLCHIWRAEQWNPEDLMQRYVKAGARYFVALANHHDNFDCWDSKYQAWNSVRVGPGRDIVGGWESIARAHGLSFGVTVHGTPGRVWREFMPVRYGSDAHGPLQGVPYDGLLTRADGKGKWWDGMDPRELNGVPHGKDDPCPEFVENFMLRVQDLIDKYHPDLLYFDDNCDWDFDRGAPWGKELNVWLGMPELTPRIMAYYYNAILRHRKGTPDAVFNIKNVPPSVRGTLVRDFEMSQADAIEAAPWQTDACIGNWHYDRNLPETHGYRSAESMVHLLVDVVSKNGNLLLNIPLPGDGRPDEDELAFLERFGAWMAINGEAIYGTRPWKIAGEGVARQDGHPYAAAPVYTASDIRFTVKGDALYAIAMGWPTDGKLVFRSLATGTPHFKGEIARIGLLGSAATLAWSRSAEGVTVRLPAQPPCEFAYAFKIDSLPG
jgi:alpha-L-fucosidase